MTFRTKLLQTVSVLLKDGLAHPDRHALPPEETPLRSELLSLEQLARHAKSLATAHRFASTRGSNRLLTRLAENEQVLREYNRTTHAVDQVRRVTHAAEWLLDNFYLFEEQIQMARRHLPRAYNRELPRLISGTSAGLPRVYDIVLELIAHVDAQIDAEPLHAFVGAYQSVCPLKLGELWAVPIMLRLALIENLRRVTSRLTIDRKDRNLADHWADRLETMATEQPSHLVIVVADMAKAEPPLSSAFVTEFCQRLAQQTPVVHIARSWLEQQLSDQGLSIEQLVYQESQNQAADQVSISHSIASLRFLSAMDWREFVETASVVDAALRHDPAGVYDRMDFFTRDRYRHAIEGIARHSRLPELTVAREAVALAAAAAQSRGAHDRTAHVGYYLIDKGQPQLERVAGVRWPWRTLGERALHRFPLTFYVGGISLLSALATGGLVAETRALSVRGWPLAICGVLFLLCSSQLAGSVINWLSSMIAKPRLLPRLDFSHGIAPECRTMVVVPTMLGRSEGIEHLIETIEIHYLANRDAHLHFALLTDFPDADAEVTPEDDARIQQAREGIEALNRKYQAHRSDIFFLFHRPRRWNPAENRWMGYERKRGKLAEFNALLRGGSADRFAVAVGDQSVLSSIKFVITLDTDTQLPRDAARQLVGAMAHPLNRPQFDPVKQIVTEGYGILQPRVGVSLPSAGRSWFVRLFAGDVGLDPYTRAISDVYQDVFNEGSFIGKGIYDVDAFEQAMAGRFPENAVLSHDLIEACHARSALISDVELYEEFPSRYNADANRRHRWIRGDWQITQWLLPFVPGTAVQRIANPLSGLSRWKIFDNLRRSLVPIALLLVLLGNWLLLPELGFLGPALVLVIVLGPGLLTNAFELFRKPSELPLSMHLRKLVTSGGRQLAQALLTLVFLPYDAFISFDAIGRTLVRLLVTRRRLLEWQTASEAEHTARTDLPGFYATMWIAPAIAVLSGAGLALFHPQYGLTAAPLLGLWACSPWIAWWISQPIASPDSELTDKQLLFLRQTARKTWRFFETFVTAGHHWLPPDNFQEQPTPVIATRTSPTNMGLALLANLAAHDFGYIAGNQLVERTQNTLATMQRLERYRGHFYNWYDTQTLKPLPLIYVSTVDSGNLAGHLLTLSSGLTELAGQPIFSPRILEGVGDTLAALRAAGETHPAAQDLARLGAEIPQTLGAAFEWLQRALEHAEMLRSASGAEANEEILWWRLAVERTCREHRDDLLFLAPWLALPSVPTAPTVDGSAGIVEKLGRLDRVPSLRAVSEFAQSLCPAIEERLEMTPGDPTDAAGEERELLGHWSRCLRDASERASERIQMLESLAGQCAELAEMDFTFLLDPTRKIFTVGFNVLERRRDNSFYDLLASESRLGSYVAIALGQVSQEHWFSLGRLLVGSRREPVLLSWSGSMFEYLMPLLVMPNYDNTLLDQTYRGVVEQQADYGRLRHVPWGISESGYNLTDVHLNYQYRAFGVPGLGLKRGLAEDLVIAPYASVMALMVAPRSACENLERLAAEGRSGAYGFYEAVDYTPSRLPPGQTSSTIRSFMVHHQGMSLLSLAYLLLDRPMQRRFMACPLLRAADLLLQERVPNIAAKVLSEDLERESSRQLTGGREDEGIMRIYPNPTKHAPEVHLLSNGRYHVVVSSAGGGYSRWRDLAVTRWREDSTRDCWGTFIYLRDVATGEYWSAATQPVTKSPNRAEAIFTQARAEFLQRNNDLEVHTDISVSPEDDVELRRVTLTNHSSEPRTIELTSYAEVVLAPAASDLAHPAFSNLFVQTEFVQPNPAILCTRRARSEGEHPPWLLHLMVGQGAAQGEISCETDRARFVGRGHTVAHPAALQTAAPLSNTTGSVLDPVVALRRTVTLAAHETARVDFVLGVTETREAALALVEKYHNPRMADRAFDLAWTHSQVTLRHLGASEADGQLYSRLASPLIYANPARRGRPSVLLANRRGQSGLWGYGISGDTPIVLLRIGDQEKIELVRQAVQAHSYWRLKGLAVELVIINEDTSVYRQNLHEQIVNLITTGLDEAMLDRPGGIFLRRVEQISAEDRVLLQSVARIVLADEDGTLLEQMERSPHAETLVPAFTPSRPSVTEVTELPTRDLRFHNGLGGFTPDGREYVITLAPGQVTPAPWVNVLANPHFGTVVSESGGAYTWAENSHEFRLTPWNNDPVTDSTGEAFYIRDEHTGQIWSPTPQPAGGATPYVIRHGFGYTVFEHTENGVASELWIYVAMDAPVKFAALKLRNLSGRPRRLSATGYWEWVLGDLRSNSLLHVHTELDPKSGALLARNPYNTEFAGRIAFIDVNDPARTLTGDRREFIGRTGSLRQPAALKRTRLSNRVGAGLDPCGAVQVAFDLAPDQDREICFRLGLGRNGADVQALIQRYRRAEAVHGALEQVWEYWNRTLGAVQIETPDPSVNVLANGWLLYQTLGSRLWGRTGFYQSGGAYGFRDQLQDVMALVHAEPALAREHLLRAAARQFREGDVQHWWHPPTGRGVRTHFSDDYLWLPYVACRYVSAVGDIGVLDEKVSFLEGRPLKGEEESYYDLPTRSEETATLYQHCVRAIEYGLKFGVHGLPLIGCGDWNDGMNLIGREGRGESVWLAFFLHDVLTQFSAVAHGRGETAFAERCLAQAATLRRNIEDHAWDGEWYRRAYFDNGDPLGSQTNPECQIDSLPQSWAVISSAGDPTRARQAMAAVERRLVRRDAGLIQLFDPPFDTSALNPGYIKGYIPGVRENGGQYTHGAIWTTMAFALMGETDRAWELLALLNPVNHGSTADRIARYRVEPYVVAADVYGVEPHTGRGGWTWYTGSAGWMYRLITETLLGLHREGAQLRLAPRLPKAWPGVTLHYRHYRTQYHLVISRHSEAAAAEEIEIVLDGQKLTGATIPLSDDAGDHTAEIKIP